MNIDMICNALLDALAEVGYHEHTIFNYKGVIRRFKAFCEKKASQNTILTWVKPMLTM